MSSRQDKKPGCCKSKQLHFLLAFSSQGSNELNQNLLKRITKSREIHLVPCQLSGRFVLRFAICARTTESHHIQQAWRHITQLTFELLQEPDHWPKGRKRAVHSDAEMRTPKLGQTFFMLQMKNVIKGINSDFTAHLAVRCVSVCSQIIQSRKHWSFYCWFFDFPS